MIKERIGKNMDKIGKNFVYNVLYHIFSLLTPIFVTPYITRLIPQDIIGANTILGVIASYFCIFGTLGMTYVGTRAISQSQVQKKNTESKFWELYKLQFSNYIVVIIIYLFFIILGNELKVLKMIYLIELIAYAIDISWFFQGMEDFKYISIRNTLIRIVSTISIFLFVKSSQDIGIYVMCLYIPQVLMNVGMWRTLFTKYKFKFEIKPFNKNLYKELIFLTIPTIAISIYTLVDKTVVGIFRPLTDVAIYEQGQVLLRVILSVVPAFCTVVLPRISFLFQTDNWGDICILLRKSSQFVWYISFGLLFGTLVLSDQFISWYLPKEYEYVSEIIKLCSPMIFIVAAENILGVQILIPLKKDREYTVSIVSAAIVNLVLDFLLIPYWGLVAACVSSVMAEAVALLMQIKYARKVIDLKNIFYRIYIYILAGSAMYLIIRCVGCLFNNSLFSLCILLILGGISYSIISYLLYKTADFIKRN